MRRLRDIQAIPQSIIRWEEWENTASLRNGKEDEPVLAAPYCLAVTMARWALARRVEAMTFIDCRP